MAFAAMSVFMRQLQIQHQNARHAIVRHPHDMMVVALALLVEDAREHRRRRSCWLKPGIQRRPFLGQYDTFMRELMREARGDFKLYLRMTPEIFLEDVQRVSPRIIKQHHRPPIEHGLQIAITLRFLETGCTYAALRFGFRVGSNTINLLIPEVCIKNMPHHKKAFAQELILSVIPFHHSLYPQILFIAWIWMKLRNDVARRLLICMR